MNLIADSIDGGKWGGGVVQYFTYSLNDWLQLGLRGEIFREFRGILCRRVSSKYDFVHIVLQGRAVPFDPQQPGWEAGAH